MLGRRRRCWSNHSHVLVQHCTSRARTFGICQTGVCSIYARRRSLLSCKCTKLKRQYVLTCKAGTYCHIISARAESCEKRAYIVRHPSSLWHAVMQWGQGGVLTTEQPVYIVYVSIHTTSEMLSQQTRHVETMMF